MQLFFGGYNYTSDIECVNSDSDDTFYIENVIFKYENDKKEFIIYNNPDDIICQFILKKREFLGETKYKSWIMEMPAPPITYHKEWTEIDKNLRYIFVDYENDIEDIDCQGFEPVGTKIYYTIANGKQESCWIYIIDESVT